MGVPADGLLELPFLSLAAFGVVLLLAYRRSTSVTVFRLAALFVAAWALLATTALAWVIARHGWPGVASLWRSPELLFAPAARDVWIWGAAGAFVVFAAAFLLCQAVDRAVLRVLRPTPLAWPAALAPPVSAISLLRFPEARADAFSFTLAERSGRWGLRRRDVILVSDALLAQLTPVEWEAVVAHEVGHLRGLDGRYLTFFRTLARMLRWDPVLAFLADALTRREEFRADLEAVAQTARPRALARALYKVSTGPIPRRSTVAGLLGTGGRRGRRQAVERIRRLVELAESGRFPEETGA